MEIIMKSYAKAGLLLAPLFLGLAGCGQKVPEDQAYCKKTPDGFSVVSPGYAAKSIADITIKNVAFNGILTGDWKDSQNNDGTAWVDLKNKDCTLFSQLGWSDYTIKDTAAPR
jgi:hypothetical protein